MVLPELKYDQLTYSNNPMEYHIRRNPVDALSQSGYVMKNKLTKCDAEDELEVSDVKLFIKNRELVD